MEPVKIDHEDIYEVTDQEEEIQILKAWGQNNPIVPEDGIEKLIREFRGGRKDGNANFKRTIR